MSKYCNCIQIETKQPILIISLFPAKYVSCAQKFFIFFALNLASFQYTKNIIHLYAILTLCHQVLPGIRRKKTKHELLMYPGSN